MKRKMTRDEILEHLEYDRESGEFSWKIAKGRNRAGSAAGTVIKGGMRKIVIEGQPYLEHQLAWLIETGDWAPSAVYHRNGIKSENWFNNLTTDRSEQLSILSTDRKIRSEQLKARAQQRLAEAHDFSVHDEDSPTSLWMVL